jgi:hypothetical protein
MITMYVVTEIFIMLLIMFTCFSTAIMISTFFVYITLDLIYKIKDNRKEKKK